MGRDNKYPTHVEPFLEDIAKWKTSMTEKQIAKKLGISPAAFQKYKNDYPELKEICMFGNKNKCGEVWSSLFKRAIGYDVPQTREVLDRDGNIRTLQNPTHHVPADIRAITLILSNLESTFHVDDAEVLRLKKELAELKKQLAEEKNEGDWECLP